MMNKLTGLFATILGGALLVGCASTGVQSSGQGQGALGYTPQLDFETDDLGRAPRGFDINGPVVVTDEMSRSGDRSIRMTRMKADENVRARQHFGAKPAGALRFSLYVPSNAQADTFVTLFQDSYRADPDRVIDVIFRARGEIRNREPNGPVVVGRFNKGQWNDVVIDWTNLSVNGTYSLTVNGSLVGNFRAERSNKVPARLDLKYGSGNSPAGAASLYLDAISID